MGPAVKYLIFHFTDVIMILHNFLKKQNILCYLCQITVLMQLQTVRHFKIDFIGVINDKTGCDRLKDLGLPTQIPISLIIINVFVSEFMVLCN